MTLTSRKPKFVAAYVDPEHFLFLEKQLMAADPDRKRGFPKSQLIEGFLGSIVIAMRRPDHYSLGEMLVRMYHAAVPPEDLEGHGLIEELRQKIGTRKSYK